jgi:hypothetical protein
MKLGTVISINLSDSNPDNFNSIIVSLKDRASRNNLRCFPLNPNSRHIPILGEQVYVIVANSDEASASSQSSRNYYISIVGLQKNVNHNALPKLTNSESSITPNFNQAFNGIPIQSSTDDAVDFGNGFIEDSNVSQLQPFLGDIIHEGRYGQSIRFGYTPQNSTKSDNKINGAAEEPTWKSTKSESPITIIRNGAGESKGYNKYVVEDINKDASSIWLTDQQTISLTLGSTLPLGITPTSIYNKPQVILNSDRIVLNSKKDNVILTSSKDIVVSTSKHTTTIDKLIEAIEILSQGTFPTAVGPTGPHPQVAQILAKIKNGVG